MYTEGCNSNPFPELRTDDRELGMGEAVRCGESSPVGGFPAVGDW